MICIGCNDTKPKKQVSLYAKCNEIDDDHHFSTSMDSMGYSNSDRK
jgi:hypothetical protein